jgi:hypothetical protein
MVVVVTQGRPTGTPTMRKMRLQGVEGQARLEEARSHLLREKRKLGDVRVDEQIVLV